MQQIISFKQYQNLKQFTQTASIITHQRENQILQKLIKYINFFKLSTLKSAIFKKVINISLLLLKQFQTKFM